MRSLLGHVSLSAFPSPAKPSPVMSLPYLASLVLAVATIAAAHAQTQTAREGPDPREIPLPEIVGPMGRLPGVNDLPVRPEMPDVFTFNDGTKVTTREQWSRRREEIKRTLAYYAVGQMPPAPGNVKGRELKSELVAEGRVKYRLVHLTFGPGEKLSLDIGIFTPSEGGPFPAIILQGGVPPGGAVLPRLPSGPNQGRGQDVLLLVGRGATPNTSATNAPPSSGTEMAAAPATSPPGGAKGNPFGPQTAETIAARNAEIFRRGYALVQFNPNDCAEDTTLREMDGTFSFRTTRFYPAYPGYDWGILGGWAWGASRVADYLETDSAIDHSKLMLITGASRNGKSSLAAAAFDERLMGAPVVTGGGGVGAYRFAGPGNSETLDIMEKKYPNWFSPRLHEFWGQREKLPFDQHWFLALCAPRPFIALEGDADTISLPEAVKQSFIAAQPAYGLFGAVEKLGVNYARHAHAFTAEDWTAMIDFADVHLRGAKATRTFDRFISMQEREAAVAAATTPRERPSTKAASAPGK
jgi:hypothetical protein